MLIRKILYIINIIASLLLAATYIPAFIPQDIVPSVSLLGYAYPLLLAVNIVFIIIWLFVKPRHVLLPLAFILIRFSYVPRLINFSASGKDKDLTVLTYNVNDFRHNMDKFDVKRIGQIQDSIIEYVKRTQADVVCYQDCTLNFKQRKGFHEQMTDSLGYNHFYAAGVQASRNNNCIIYSKYPITNAGSVLPGDANQHSYIFADVQTPVQKVRIYNMHLASYMLGVQEQSDYSAIIKGKVSDTASRNIVHKLLSANKRRAKQVRRIIPAVENSAMPVIVAGDFNDHPFSNTYRRFSKLYKDAFTAKGNGIGRSYNGVFPAYRIDYIFYKQSRLEAVEYISEPLDLSDHYPVLVKFKIKKQ
ncbi:MAG: endonuclease/exonuclease/phosphatase family protein [Bacteroidales bacterium]|nr:endonuclease/exonuclease/phosphatase family protein [Bacteroidales bacterium]